MPGDVVARKIPVKLSFIGQKSAIKIAKYGKFAFLGLVPFAYFFPHIVLILYVFIFVLWGYSIAVAPRPMFEKWRSKAWVSKDKSNWPCLYIGTDDFNFPLEVPSTVLKQHMLLIGSTGSGKTSLLRRMIHQQLLAGGGCCFVDGKADVSDMYQIFYSEVVHCDREEDFVLINFLNPEQSHTFNPFLYGDADFLSEVMNGLLKEATGEHVYWQQRAIEQMRALLTVLVWLRDQGRLNLYIGTIQKYLNFHEMVKLVKDPTIPDFDERGKPVKDRLKMYLSSLTPNYDKELSAEELAEVTRLFSYGVQEWSTTLDLFRVTYGAIFDTQDPDIDVKDVVLNNKVWYVLLPALKQSPQTLSAIGRFLLSTFKIVFSELIGDSVIGDAKALYEETRSKKPDPAYLMILDEAGSYLPDDMDTVLAQARSTGVGVIISVQEIASLMKLNEAKAKRILNNTKLKICLAVDDPDSAKYYVERAGEDWALVPSIKRNEGLIDYKYHTDSSVSYQKMGRINVLDLYALSPGKGYVIYMDEVRKFYTPELKMPRPEEMRLLVLERRFTEETVGFLKELFPKEVRVGDFTVVWDDRDIEWMVQMQVKKPFKKMKIKATGIEVPFDRVGFKLMVDEFYNLALEDEEFIKLMKDEGDFIKEFFSDNGGLDDSYFSGEAVGSGRHSQGFMSEN